MSCEIILPPDFWPKQGDTFEAELTQRVQDPRNIPGRIRRRVTIPAGKRGRFTLLRYTISTDYRLRATLASPATGHRHVVVISREGERLGGLGGCYDLKLPIHVLISAYQQHHPSHLEFKLGLEKGSLPFVADPGGWHNPKRYTEWMRILCPEPA